MIAAYGWQHARRPFPRIREPEHLGRLRSCSGGAILFIVGIPLGIAFGMGISLFMGYTSAPELYDPREVSGLVPAPELVSDRGRLAVAVLARLIPRSAPPA